MRERRASLVLSRAAVRDLNRLSDSDAVRVAEELAVLRTSPLAGKPLKGSLSQARRVDFGLSGGWFRAAYVFDSDARTVIVFMVAPRGGFYKEAERRYRSLKR